MLKVKDIIYNKYGDSATVKSVTGEKITIILQKSYVFNEGGVYKKSKAKPEESVISENDFGISYFYKIEDIGNMEILTNPSGAYCKNIQAIQDNYKKELAAHADVLPAGERMDEQRKQRFINLYYDLKNETKKEGRFIEKHKECFARIDLDTKFEVGHEVKYFRSRNHDKCYLTKGDYKKLPDGTHIVNWRSDIADFYYNKEKTSCTRGFYLNVFDETRVDDVPGIEYVYNLMLKRSFATNPFAIKNLYIGGSRSEAEYDDEVNIYEEGSVDPFLIQIIEEKRLDNKLTDIIVSIQANQNEMIRHDHKKNMLVQGCAGSGKTMILLHRISYLKYHKHIKNFDKTVIIVPNNNFNLFIDELAENLEIDKMPRMTMRQYYLKLAKEYQAVLDKKFGNSVKSIDDQFKKLSKKGFMKTNMTFPNEDFSDDFEYSLCDFYDQSIKEYYKQIELDTIISIAERFGIKFDSETAMFEQFNELYSIVSQKGKIWSTYNLMVEDEKRKLQPVERKWKTYENLIYNLKMLIDKFTFLTEKVAEDSTIKQIKTQLEEVSQLKNIIAEKETLVEKLKKESESAPRGFLRILSNAKNISKEKLEKEVSELDALKKEYDDLSSNISEDSTEIINDALNQLESTKEIVAKEPNVDSVYWDGILNYLLILLEQIDDGAISLKRGIEEIDSKCSEIEKSSEINNTSVKYEEIKKHYDEVVALGPNDSESEILKNAENILKNRRLFITRLFKKSEGIDISEIDKGRQIFTLIALYCLHIGRLNTDLEYIFVDEGQDYSESEYRILRAIHKDSCRFEVYGDVAQCITVNRGLHNWDYLKDLFEADYFEMKENYRNTVEVAEYINKNVMNVFNTIGFRGPEVVEKSMEWSNPILDEIKKEEGKRIAVIYHDKDNLEDVDSQTYEYLIRNNLLYNVSEAKGLEFEVVFVILEDMSVNEKYVALSRSLKKLYVLE